MAAFRPCGRALGRWRCLLAAATLRRAADEPCAPVPAPLRLAAAPADQGADRLVQRAGSKAMPTAISNSPAMSACASATARCAPTVSATTPRPTACSSRARCSYNDPTIRVEGDSGNYGDDGAQFQRRALRAAAAAGTRHGRDRSSCCRAGASNSKCVTYTTCPRGAADWQLRARRITLDTDTSAASAATRASSSRACPCSTCRGSPFR